MKKNLGNIIAGLVIVILLLVITAGAVITGIGLWKMAVVFLEREPMGLVWIGGSIFVGGVLLLGGLMAWAKKLGAKKGEKPGEE